MNLTLWLPAAGIVACRLAALVVARRNSREWIALLRDLWTSDHAPSPPADPLDGNRT